MSDFFNILIESIKNLVGIIFMVINYFLYMKLFTHREIGYVNLRMSLLSKNDEYIKKGLKQIFFNNYMQTSLLLVTLLIYYSFYDEPFNSGNTLYIFLFLFLIPLILFFLEIFIKLRLNDKFILYIQSVFIFILIDSNGDFFDTVIDGEFFGVIFLMVLGIITQKIIKKTHIKSLSLHLEGHFLNYMVYAWNLRIQLACILILMTIAIDHGILNFW